MMEPTKIYFVAITLFLCTGSPVQSRKSDGFHMRDLRVDCSKDGMVVTVDFDGPFEGIIYSRGHYNNPSCRYAGSRPGSGGYSTVTFRVPLNGCGTDSEGRGRDGATRLENTLVIQGDPDIQEAWDLARRIRCLWQDTIARTVTAKPFQVSQTGSESLSFAEDNINAIMEVQQGRGPFSKPVSGYLHLGEESSLVVYLQDPSRRFDARMVDCRAMGGPRAPSQLVLTDGQGCPVRPDLISPFYKTRDTRNTGADLIMYTHFRAFRLPDSSNFNIKCNMQVCDKLCTDYCANRTRSKRDETGVKHDLQVDSKGDSKPGSHLLNVKVGFRGDNGWKAMSQDSVSNLRSSRDSQVDSQGGSQLLDMKTGLRGDNGWKVMSQDSVINLRLSRDRKTDFKEDDPNVLRRNIAGVIEGTPKSDNPSISLGDSENTPGSVLAGPTAFSSEDDLQGDLNSKSGGVSRDIQGKSNTESGHGSQGGHGDHGGHVERGGHGNRGSNGSVRGHKVLEHRVEVLTEEEVHQKKQLCFVQSSWVAICGVLGAGYLCLGIVVWVLILRIRAYGHLVKCLRERKAAG